MDFYKTLYSLNQFEVTQKSTKSDLAAAYLISREITIEIMNYAEQFLKDSSINKKMLKLPNLKIGSFFLTNFNVLHINQYRY